MLLGVLWGNTAMVWAGPTAPDFPETRTGATPWTVIQNLTQPGTEPRYDIEREQPNLGAGLSWCINDPLYNLDYFLNEQTYAGFNIALPPPDEGFGTIINVYGSYLFNFGLFVGMDYYAWGESNAELTISPGYRFNLQNKGYLAARLNFANGNTSSGIYSYQLEGQYYNETMLMTGQIVLPKDSLTTIVAGANFKTNDELIWGINCGTGKQFDCTAGFTWSKNDWAVETTLGTSANAFYYDVNGLYKISEQFSLGLEGKSENVNSLITFKAKYQSKLFNLNLMYDFNPAMVYLTYKLNI